MNIMDIFNKYSGLGAMTAATLTVADILHRRHHGSITLGHGMQSISIATDFTPSKVYLSLDTQGHQVCGAVPDMATAIPTLTGFTIIASIQSSACLVEWLSE